MNDFQILNKVMLQYADRFVKFLLPKGRRECNEWVALNPMRNDRNLGSFRINLRNGRWADFATGDKGSDLVSLYAYLRRCTQFEALKILESRYL